MSIASELIPAAVILAGPLLLLAPIVYALRPSYATADRDMTGSFPVVRAA